MKINFKILFVIAFLTLIMSCDDKEQNDQNSLSSNERQELEKLYDANSNLKREFGKALMVSMNESRQLRDLIKNKALEKFDNDYEVLYEMIKDEKLENNMTVKESLLKNLKDKTLLDKIEISNPTLTILVPELPEDSFSAQLWNTENQIPKIAIRLNTSNDVPLINLDGTEQILESKYIPAFPVIVLKDNERIIADNNITDSNKTNKSFAKINGVSYRFLDDCFDKSKNLKSTLRIAPIQVFDPNQVASIAK